MKAFVGRAGALATLGILLLACVKINEGLGADYMESSQLYDIYSVEVPLENIRMEFPDSLSGLSDSRITIGAVKDDVYGTTTRSCALTLVPALDTVDFGKDPVFQRMHFAAAVDTLSYPDEESRYIIQQFKVYELDEPINFGKLKTNSTIKRKDVPINDGPVIYSGGDSLSFDFTREFGQRFLDELDWRTDLDTMPHYTAKFPGIIIESDRPSANGGRINCFKVPSVTYSSSYKSYVLNGNHVTLKLNAEYEGERKDTAFLFLWGETDLIDEASYVEASTSQAFPQYALNLTGHETRGMTGVATDEIYIEGGGGLKPVIDARELKNIALDVINKYGDPSSTVITNASVVLPFELPGSWYQLDHAFPVILSPTMRILSDGRVSFAGLSDSSVSTENQGGINRSTLCYEPDITNHLQHIINLEDEDELDNYDIWLLIMSKVTVETVNDTSYSDAYTQMMYYSYLNSIYGGYGGYGGYGYGGYGYGYGGYGGYGYSNYYNYAMMAAMMSASSGGTSSSVSTILDRDAYFRASLNGPTSPNARKPFIRITVAVPKG
ncbi:MAG: hypothetical protein J6W74_05255 [Bacteroidales bacterium]|nr:hypothetical protein [Bacteroidales bacterium]